MPFSELSTRLNVQRWRAFSGRWLLPSTHDLDPKAFACRHPALVDVTTRPVTVWTKRGPRGSALQASVDLSCGGTQNAYPSSVMADYPGRGPGKRHWK